MFKAIFEMFDIESFFLKSVVVAIVMFVFGLIGLGLFRATFVTFTDNFEMAYEYNKFTGDIKVLEGSGYWVRNPVKYAIHSIDLRPIQVQVTGGMNSPTGQGGSVSGVSQRVLNAKLVQFDPKGFDAFMKWHGRGAGGSQSELAEILRCYAFDRDDGKDCPFLTVLNQLEPGQAGTPIEVKK